MRWKPTIESGVKYLTVPKGGMKGNIKQLLSQINKAWAQKYYTNSKKTGATVQ